MNLKKLKRATFSLGVISIMLSCTTDKTFTYSADQIEKLTFMEKNDISLAMLKSLSSDEDVCNTICCDDTLYCGITKSQVIPFIKRYRDEDWKFTSEFFNLNPSTNVGITMREINDGTWQQNNPTQINPLNNHNNFDARFMDIPLAELENYLCHIKNNPLTSTTNICRFYYIKYGPDNAFDRKYHNKHTLAIVPVRIDPISGGGNTTTEFTVDSLGNQMNTIYTVGQRSCTKSPMANHNHLCPPFTGCTKGTMIEEVDSQ